MNLSPVSPEVTCDRAPQHFSRRTDVWHHPAETKEKISNTRSVKFTGRFKWKANSMSKVTSIQWCHSTVNPVAGCDGCPLWPSEADLEVRITNAAMQHVPNADRVAVKTHVREALQCSDKRMEQARVALGSVLTRYVPSLSDLDHTLAWKELKQGFRCYAGVLTHRFQGKSPKAYPENFDVAQRFPGRMQAAAAYGLPSEREIHDKPWLQGLRRLLFVSDMGDALSENIDFSYLKKEIVDVVTSEAGARHVWLWLTKRAPRMAEFSDWLQASGTGWPVNLIPMASILNHGYARQAVELLRIPSVARGFSVEPLDAPLTLPQEILGPNSWVILGGESGNGARAHPFEIEWARGIRDQCAATGTPFFMKQLGAVATEKGKPYATQDSHGGEWSEWPRDLRVREFPAEFRSAARN